MGEGDGESARRDNEDTREYVERVNVEEAARGAAPKDDKERKEMEKSERTGKAHAKEGDPNVPRDYSNKS
jgi:hypothetical protein